MATDIGPTTLPGPRQRRSSSITTIGDEFLHPNGRGGSPTNSSRAVEVGLLPATTTTTQILQEEQGGGEQEQQQQQQPNSHNRRSNNRTTRMVSPRLSFLDATTGSSGNSSSTTLGSPSPSLSSISTQRDHHRLDGPQPLVMLPPAAVHALRVPSPKGMHMVRRLRRLEGTSLGSAASDSSSSVGVGGGLSPSLTRKLNDSDASVLTAPTARSTIVSNSSSSSISNSSSNSSRSHHRHVAIMTKSDGHHHRHKHHHVVGKGEKLQWHDQYFVETSHKARVENDAMVYLDGHASGGVYSCQACRTHLTSHADIISKSFHGRHGRAYLFDQCHNITVGPAEDRTLITGLHTVSDIFCKRCNACVGWTYQKAYEASQKYKEGKFIIEKINLYLEVNPSESSTALASGERWGRRKQRSSHCREWDPHHHRHHDIPRYDYERSPGLQHHNWIE